MLFPLSLRNRLVNCKLLVHLHHIPYCPFSLFLESFGRRCDFMKLASYWRLFDLTTRRFSLSPTTPIPLVLPLSSIPKHSTVHKQLNLLWPFHSWACPFSPQSQLFHWLSSKIVTSPNPIKVPHVPEYLHYTDLQNIPSRSFSLHPLPVPTSHFQPFFLFLFHLFTLLYLIFMDWSFIPLVHFTYHPIVVLGVRGSRTYVSN